MFSSQTNTRQGNKKTWREKYIGSKAFYSMVLKLVIPMILQNLITNFVSMIDNIMIGQVGTAQMSGVSIVNQFIFVFNITIFGGVSGASIFGTQYFGKGDYEGQRYSFRFRIVLTGLLIAVSACIFTFFGPQLISLFISGEDTPDLAASTLEYGKIYLSYMILSLIPFGFGQAYSSAIRECGETRIPMIGSLSAIWINVLLDYALIFGRFGLPCLGVAGAAIATVIAKTVEAAVVILWAHTHLEKNKFLAGAYKSFHIPLGITKDIIIKGCPLLANEFCWSIGMSVIAQSYSVRGLEVVAARNIASTITNLYNVIFLQLGAGAAIIIGAKLGAGKMEEARDTVNRMLLFSTVIIVIFACLAFPPAFVFPTIYNTEASVKALATWIIIVHTVCLPIFNFTNLCYFTLRSGGKTIITFLFDFTFTWFVMIPLAFILSRYTNVEIHALFFIVTFSEFFKCIVGYFLIKSNIWMQTLVDNY